MKRWIIILGLLSLVTLFVTCRKPHVARVVVKPAKPIVQIQTITLPQYFELVADAIYREEGGAKTRFPYGISIYKAGIQTKSVADARRICINTIKTAWQMWQDGGRKGPFIHTLAMKYDLENWESWESNVTKILGKVPPIVGK